MRNEIEIVLYKQSPGKVIDDRTGERLEKWNRKQPSENEEKYMF